jgi:glycosyltransferase involved in cell wall biosynthesis
MTNQKPKLLYVIQSFNMGGAEHLSLIISQYLQKNASVEPIVCALEGTGPLREALETAGIRVIDLGKKPGVDFRTATRLRGFLKKEKISIMHVHNLGPLLYGFLATRFMMEPPLFLYTEHVRLEQEVTRTSLLFVHRLIARKVDLFVSIAQHISEYASERLGLKGKKLITIPNCIDIQKYSINEISEDLGALKNSGRLLIGCTAALRPQKDHGTLIRSMTIVTQSIPNALLVLIGDGPCRKQLEDLVQELRLDQNVYFAGYQSNIPAILQAFDVIALSSLYEGLSLAALEGMAAGKPVVLTDVYGNAELIQDESFGILVTPQSPEAMAKALISLLHDDQLRKRMGTAARHLVAERYDIKTMLKSYAELYDSLITYGV